MNGGNLWVKPYVSLTRIRHERLHDRVEVRQPLPEERARHDALARARKVHVAAEGVDLAVVRQVPVVQSLDLEMTVRKGFSYLLGWALSQLGKVLVENLVCTMHTWVRKSSLARSW